MTFPFIGSSFYLIIHPFQMTLFLLKIKHQTSSHHPSNSQTSSPHLPSSHLPIVHRKSFHPNIFPFPIKTYIPKTPENVYLCQTMQKQAAQINRMAVVVTAAGFSGRMGIPKAALAFDEKFTFAEQITQTFLKAGVAKVVLVVNADGMKQLKKSLFLQEEEKVEQVFNPFPEKERFFSLQTGLKTLTGFQAVFLHNVDNPFVNTETIRQLTNCFRPGGFVVPRHNHHGGHPILIAQEIVRDLTAFPDSTINLRAFLSRYPKIHCPVNDDRIHININTAKEYTRYFGKPPRL